MVMEFINRVTEAASGLIDQGRQAVAANVMAEIHRDPSQLDTAIDAMGPQARQFYDRLGPTGQENLKGIIAQDARFLPALARAMEGGAQPGADGQAPASPQGSMLTSMPPGLTNVVLTEMNNDPQFRTRMIETLEQDPSKVADVVGTEAGNDTRFGMALGREALGSAVRGELNLGALGGMNMGGMMQGLMGGMFGGLLQNFGGLFDGLKEIFGKIFESLAGILGGDRMVQSVGDAPVGQRPIDFATRMAQISGIAPGGEIYLARNGEVTPRGTTDVTVGADTPMDPSRRVLPDPTTGLAAGPR